MRAMDLVLPDFRDEFVGSSKETYKSCITSQITYSENATESLVSEACKGQLRWHGESVPVTIPLNTHWRLVDGQWYWYTVKVTEVRTPFGISKITPASEQDGTSRPAIPPDPAALAKSILQQVKVDRSEVRLDSSKASEDAVTVSNGMPGPITISVDNIGQAGLHIQPEKTELKAGETARVMFRYDPADPAVLCKDCAERLRGTITAQIRVQPTAQVFPITVILNNR